MISVRKFGALFDFKAGWFFVFGTLLCVTLVEYHLWGKFYPIEQFFVSLLASIYAVFVSNMVALARIPGSDTRIVPFFKRFALFAQYIGVLFCIETLMSILTYAVCAWDQPYVDIQFARADAWLGFNWLSGFRWLQKSSLKPLLSISYISIFYQQIFFALWFSFKNDHRRLYEFFWIIVIAAAATVLLSGIFPSLGPAVLFNMQGSYNALGQMRFAESFADIQSVRAGLAPEFMLHGSLQGIVCMPSFHTVSALVYIYAFRKTGVLTWIILALNVLMLASTPHWGNHYLVDMFGGAAVAYMAILLGSYVNERFFNRGGGFRSRFGMQALVGPSGSAGFARGGKLGGLAPAARRVRAPTRFTD